MKCLVTGAAGFVGSTLSAKLLSEGHEVIGIDSFTDYYDVGIKRRNVSTLDNPRLTMVEADLNTVNLEQLLAGVEVVFHQAGQPGVRKSWGSDFSHYVDANVRATQRLLEALKASDTIARIVYASSSSVYGDAERFPTSEVDLPAPVSPYGVTKLAAEHLCSLYAKNFGLPTVSLRYFTVYGPRQRTDMAFTRFVRSAIRGDEITVYGDGSQLRDFTYIDDVVAANIACTVNDVPPGQIYNVAGGGTTSIRDVLSILSDLGGQLNVVYGEKVSGDVFRTGGSTERIRQELGWSPQVGIHEGLAKQFEWGKSEFSPESN